MSAGPVQICGTEKPPGSCASLSIGGTISGHRAAPAELNSLSRRRVDAVGQVYQRSGSATANSQKYLAKSIEAAGCVVIYAMRPNGWRTTALAEVMGSRIDKAVWLYIDGMMGGGGGGGGGGRGISGIGI